MSLPEGPSLDFNQIVPFQLTIKPLFTDNARLKSNYKLETVASVHYELSLSLKIRLFFLILVPLTVLQ
jgi:hypothetical protein